MNTSMPTIATLKKFAKDHRTVNAVAEVIAARLVAKTTRAKVDAYIAPVFARFTFNVAEDKQGRRGVQTKITHPRDLYLCEDDATCFKFYAACDEAHRANGWDIPTGYCPALMAESRATDAEQALLKMAGELFGVPFERMHGKDREKAVALFLDVVKLPA